MVIKTKMLESTFKITHMKYIVKFYHWRRLKEPLSYGLECYAFLFMHDNFLKLFFTPVIVLYEFYSCLYLCSRVDEMSIRYLEL